MRARRAESSIPRPPARRRASRVILSAIRKRRRRASSAAAGASAERDDYVELVRGGGGRGRAHGITSSQSLRYRVVNGRGEDGAGVGSKHG
jgi:hypothetical protein